jgi:hypothetical protein
MSVLPFPRERTLDGKLEAVRAKFTGSVLPREACQRKLLCLVFRKPKQKWIDTPGSAIATMELWWTCRGCGARTEFIVNSADHMRQFLKWFAERNPGVRYIVLPDGDLLELPDLSDWEPPGRPAA